MNTETGWRDISTAPRDLTNIIVGWYEDELVFSPDWKKVIGKKKVWKSTIVWGDEKDTEWTLTETGDYASSSDPSQEPTHWHPLPSPPPLP
jgi:hypothetical protein